MNRPVALGDIADLHAYCATVVRRVLRDVAPQDVEDWVSEAMLLAVQIARRVPEGDSVAAAVGLELGCDLIDRWREATREHRRNTRAGTETMIVATGLAEEHGQERMEYAPAWQDTAAESRMFLSAITCEADLHDQRLLTRLLGASVGGLPTGRAADAWSEVEAERDTFTL